MAKRVRGCHCWFQWIREQYGSDLPWLEPSSIFEATAQSTRHKFAAVHTTPIWEIKSSLECHSIPLSVKLPARPPLRTILPILHQARCHKPANSSTHSFYSKMVSLWASTAPCTLKPGIQVIRQTVASGKAVTSILSKIAIRIRT